MKSVPFSGCGLLLWTAVPQSDARYTCGHAHTSTVAICCFFDKRKIVLFKPLNKSGFITAVIPCASIKLKYWLFLWTGEQHHFITIFHFGNFFGIIQTFCCIPSAAAEGMQQNVWIMPKKLPKWKIVIKWCCSPVQRKSQYLSFIEAQGITAVIKPLLFNGLNRTIFRLSKKQHMATVLVWACPQV